MVDKRSQRLVVVCRDGDLVTPTTMLMDPAEILEVAGVSKPADAPTAQLFALPGGGFRINWRPTTLTSLPSVYYGRAE